MILLTEGASMSRLFDLDWQLVADASLMIVAVFFLFLGMSYFLFNPARKMLNDRRDKIKNELESARNDMPGPRCHRLTEDWSTRSGGRILT